MRKQMIENAAYEVATQVREVEDLIDNTLAEIAELQARVMRVDAVAGVSFGVIHPTLQQLATAVSNLVETRGAIVACHEALVDAKAKVPGLRTVATGDTECPERPMALTGLRVVA